MTRVAVLFGGRSVEHEVSVITAHQAMAALSLPHRAVPVYIAKDGRWYTGDGLRDLQRFADVDRLLAECTQVTALFDPPRGVLTLQEVGAGTRRGMFGRGGSEGVEVDVAMPLLHGPFGEDGTVQGVLELAGIPYTGSGVAASAVAMDKRLSKTVFRAAALPVLDDVLIDGIHWEGDAARCIAATAALGASEFFVKPLTLGSSIGVSRAVDEATLRDAVDLALTYDTRCIVEAAQDGIVEVNCAVLGDETATRASLLEQPTTRGLLSYDDKYRAKSGGSKGMKTAQRLIPAPLDPGLTAHIRAAASTAFAAVGASGVARVDFLVDPARSRFVVNEINALPGSLSFYLFEPDGLPFSALLDELIAIATRRHARLARTTRAFERWMLQAPGPKSAG
ncbi:MAG: D-alanine--D-alanine ligase [Candidatus Dormibacteraeota bacterium]|nr:D-alanine--D-alanine ligase [Candidatus Dormibacteraeota bacterium]